MLEFWDNGFSWMTRGVKHNLFRRITFYSLRFTGAAGSPVKMLLIVILLISTLQSVHGADEFKFALPEFDTDYTRPTTEHPEPEGAGWEYLNTGILFTCLVLAAWFILKLRSRKAVYGLTLFSLLYFGFYRQGCICPVGAVQNAVLALFDSSYLMPLATGAVFLLPLLFALFFGRVFCAAVCPLGAAQEVTALKPVRMPGWIEHTLGLIPYVFLGVAVLFAATGAGFPVCRLDPYVTVFRLSGSIPTLMWSIVFIALGVIIARPYCRYLCPLGALLRIASFFTKWHCSITPDECVQCRLCEDSCPVGAIRSPSPEQELEPRKTGIRRLSVLFILLPVILGLGMLAGYFIHPVLSRSHGTVRLADRVRAESRGETVGTTLESDAFRSSNSTLEDLFKEAGIKQKQFRTGSILLGLFLGMVIWGKIFSLSISRSSTDYSPDRMKCVSCSRCFMYCPRERLRINDKESKKGNPDDSRD